MSVDGALVSTNAMFLPGRSLEFTATFSGAPYQHAGFAVTFGEGLWAMFSSGAGDGLYARTNNSATGNDTAIPGSWFGTPHRFRIDWSASRIDYAIDACSSRPNSPSAPACGQGPATTTATATR